jgi:WD40 repeat protein
MMSRFTGSASSHWGRAASPLVFPVALVWLSVSGICAATSSDIALADFDDRTDARLTLGESVVLPEIVGDVEFTSPGFGGSGQALLCHPVSGEQIRYPPGILDSGQGAVMMWVRCDLDMLPDTNVDLWHIDSGGRDDGSLFVDMVPGDPWTLRFVSCPNVGGEGEPRILSVALDSESWRDGDWNHVAARWGGFNVDIDGHMSLQLNRRYGDTMEWFPHELHLADDAPLLVGVNFSGMIDDLLIGGRDNITVNQLRGSNRGVLEALWRVVDAFPTSSLGPPLVAVLPTGEVEREILPWLRDRFRPEALAQGGESGDWRLLRALVSYLRALDTHSSDWSRSLAEQALTCPDMPAHHRADLEDCLLPADAIHSSHTFGHSNQNSESRIQGLEFLPDGQHILSMTGYGNVALWNIETGEQIWEEEGMIQSSPRLAVSPDGRLGAVCGSHHQRGLWVFDTMTGELRMEASMPRFRAADCLAFLPGGTRLLAGSHHQDVGLALWDIPSGEMVRQITLGNGIGAWAVAMAEDGRHFVVAGSNQGLAMGDLGTGEISPWEMEGQLIREIRLLPGDRCVMLGTHPLRLCDLVENREIRQFRPEFTSVQAWAVDPGGQMLLIASRRRQWPIHELPSGERRYTLVNHGQVVEAAALSSDGCWAAVGDLLGNIALYPLPPVGTSPTP